MKIRNWASLIFSIQLIIIGQGVFAQNNQISQTSFDISVNSGDEVLIHVEGQVDIINQELRINGDSFGSDVFTEGIFNTGKTVNRSGELIFIQFDEGHKLYHVAKVKNGHRIRNIPLWLSILPPAIAILLALLFREVISALFIGVFSGAFIAGGLRIESLYYIVLSFYDTVNKYLIETLADSDHLAVVLFSTLIGGMVAIISRNGGMAGVINKLSKYAKTPASSQFVTWLVGIAIFFDDYANTLIVGNTMRSLTDKFKISREKLAYIVDSTAAPVAAVAFITTWIGAELGYIADGIQGLEGFDTALTPYSIFLSSLKYAYYPILTLIFILMIVFMKRDYGPMYNAEFRARTTGKVSSAVKGMDDEPDMEDLSPIPNIPHRWYNAVIPVSLVVIVTAIGLLSTGMEKLHSNFLATGQFSGQFSWSNIWSQMDLAGQENPTFFMKLGLIIGSSNSFTALVWASISGVLAAIILTTSQRIMKLHDTMFNMLTGFKTMLPAIVILCLAWSLAGTTHDLHTAEFITSALQGIVNPYFMPMIIFLLSGIIAFSTGSSWSTMAILFPIAIPASWYISMSNGLDVATSTELLFNVISVILGASVLGDHCSPISDTTILSSLASDCNHIDHVRTQLPYALTVGFVSVISITVVALIGANFWINTLILFIDIFILYLIIRYFGKILPVVK